MNKAKYSFLESEVLAGRTKLDASVTAVEAAQVAYITAYTAWAEAKKDDTEWTTGYEILDFNQ